MRDRARPSLSTASGELLALVADCRVDEAQRAIDAVDKGARIVIGGNRHELGGTFSSPLSSPMPPPR